MKFILLGAGFETGNMGVSALAHGSIAVMLANSPNASITLMDYGMAAKTYNVTPRDSTATVSLLNIRYSKNIFLPNHIFRLCGQAFLLRAMPRRLRENLIRRNRWLNAMQEADSVCAISGGDSFSDIYGINRLFYVSLPQVLALLLQRPLVLLPQTYGPFETFLGKSIANWILQRATRIYSRDQAGIDVVKAAIPNSSVQTHFAIDVAFAMVPKPSSPPLPTIPPGSVGINVSGLLYSSNWAEREKKNSYAKILLKLVDFFVIEAGRPVVLIPHVPEDSEESDVTAAKHFHQSLPPELRKKVLIADVSSDAREIKYVIGGCKFFVGSRMHACIAALSQGIPAVGLAYSRKFLGVFESVGVGGLVIDLNASSVEEVAAQTKAAWFERHGFENRLTLSRAKIMNQAINLSVNPTVDGVKNR